MIYVHLEINLTEEDPFEVFIGHSWGIYISKINSTICSFLAFCLVGEYFKFYLDFGLSDS